MGVHQIQKHGTANEAIEELKNITDTGFPILAMGLISYLKNMIVVACMGRLGSLELAGGALAIGFTNITGYSVLSGLAMGMEPLCSQAFGSRNLTIMSQTLQRTILMLLLTSIPIALLWINLEPVMIALHQDPEISRVASLYCKYAIPDLIANSFLHPLRIYLRSKGTTWPLLWCTSLAILLHIPMTMYITFNLSLGIKGISISTFIANFNTLFFLVCYIVYTRARACESVRAPEHTHELLSKPSSLRDEWGVLLRLAIPSCIGVCLEWWWYELMTLLAGYLEKPHVALATSAIVIQTTSLMYTLPSALSASISTRVGNELGAGRARTARLASIVAIILAFLTSIFGFLLTTLGRESWGRVFTKDNEVLKLTASVLPIIGLCELANCPQTTCCGVLRGCARPGIGAGINFYSFYLMGTPVAIALAFVWKLGFIGLCFGLLSAQLACIISMMIVIHKTDWERESMKAKDLVGDTHKFAYQNDLVEYPQEDIYLKV